MISRSIVEEKLRKSIPLFDFIPPQNVYDYLKAYNIDLEKYRCFKCCRKISADNVGAIFANGEHISIVCSECFRKHNIFMLYREFLENARK